MTEAIPEMIDAVFDIRGEMLPASYPFALWKALQRRIPLLESDISIGVIPLRTIKSADGMLLPRRSKLALRLPSSLAIQALSLSGFQLDIDGNILELSNGKLRKIQAYSTLHAHLVSTTEDELQFLATVTVKLKELDIKGKLICGLHNHMISHEREIHGYSLVIHDLKPDDSIRLQYTGLGADRRFGCGIFVPYKVITDLD